MTYSDLLHFYARKGPIKAFRKSAYRKFCRRNLGKKVTVKCNSGFSMHTVIGDSVDNQIALYGIFETGTTHVIESLAPVCSSFIDVGCNIGYYSCLFAQKAPEKTLLAIDPNPLMVERTEANLALNKASKYKVLNAGIGSERGTLSLNIPRFRHSLSSFAYVPDRGGPSETIECEILPLHSLIPAVSIEASLVKIDTEGFEFEVFCGLTEESIEKIHFILFELSASNLGHAGVKPSDIFLLPALKAFDTYLIKDDDNGYVEKVDASQLSKDESVNENVLLVRRNTESENCFKRSIIRVYQ